MLRSVIIWLARSSAPENPHRRRKLFFIFLLFLLPIFVLSFISNIREYQILTELSLARRQLTIVPAALALGEKINKLKAIGQTFAVNPQIKAAINAGDWKKAMDIIDVFQSVIDEPFIDRIFLSGTEGTLMAGFPEIEGQNFASRDWYKGVVRTGKPYLSEAYKPANQPQYNVVALAIPVVDDQNLFKAVIVIHIRLESFLAWTKDIAVDVGSKLYIVDQAGRIVAHPDISPENKIVDYSNVPAVSNIIKGMSGLDTEADPLTGNPEVVAYRAIPEYGWGIVISEPVNDVFAERNKETIKHVVSHAFVFLVFCLMLSLLLRASAHYPVR